MFDNLAILVSSLSVLILFYRYLLGFLFRINKGIIDFQSSIVNKDYSWQPIVSFTIPCYNEGEHIYKTVKTILDQNWPKDKLEIIIIDDKSTDDTFEWALKCKNLGNVIVYQNKINLGKRKSLIFATRLSKGEICISVDSDVILHKNATRELVSCFKKNPEIGAVGGKVGISNPDENWITQTQEIKYFFAYELFKSTENLFKTVLCLSGCLTAYRKKALLDIEDVLKQRYWMGIEIKYGEDRFLTHQLVLHGWKTFINLDARCWTRSPNSLQNLFSQQLRWRRSNIINWIYAICNIKKYLKKIHPVILMYYFSLALYIMIYPLIMLHSFTIGWGVQVIFIHLIVLLFLASIYQITMAIRKEPMIKSSMAYLGLGVILPISYLIITPLALFTLDSGSWETRKK